MPGRSVVLLVTTKKLYPTADSPSMPVTAEALPKKYSDREATILQVEVGGRALEKDFTLTK
ncbi:MAG: hypothetical protein U0793_03500 [Gemmataceae bacterium]